MRGNSYNGTAFIPLSYGLDSTFDNMPNTIAITDVQDQTRNEAFGKSGVYIYDDSANAYYFKRYALEE